MSELYIWNPIEKCLKICNQAMFNGVNQRIALFSANPVPNYNIRPSDICNYMAINSSLESNSKNFWNYINILNRIISYNSDLGLIDELIFKGLAHCISPVE